MILELKGLKELKLVLHFIFEVAGKWGDWSAWSECSSTCGPGTKVRSRECDSPAPAYGGECTGTGQETAQCVIRDCPSSKCEVKSVCLERNLDFGHFVGQL